ncbi:hypothetical protein GCM10023223_02210 [Stackebrandtia albiflava]
MRRNAVTPDSTARRTSSSGRGRARKNVRLVTGVRTRATKCDAAVAGSSTRNRPARDSRASSAARCVATGSGPVASHSRTTSGKWPASAVSSLTSALWSV